MAGDGVAKIEGTRVWLVVVKVSKQVSSSVLVIQ